MKKINPKFMERTLELARLNVKNGAWPFSTVIVKNNVILAEGVNSIHESCDPSDHAEIQAVRKACKKLDSTTLTQCDIYVVGMPCPMCLTCLILAKPQRIIFAVDVENKDKALTKLPLTQSLYEMIKFPVKDIGIKLVHFEEFTNLGVGVFKQWNDK